MLEQVARHGLMNLSLFVKGDVQVDAHHTIEDTGIVLGQLIKDALGDKSGIRRYGSATLPMDDALVLCALDLCGRPYLAFDAAFTTPFLGEMDTEMVREFFRAVSVHGGMNLHIKVLSGVNNHHIAECIFKAFGRALCEAVAADKRVQGVPSTKGDLS
jgi:imidazoleglycerol-phosphate dehydratase